MGNAYGTCQCGQGLSPVWFTEDEMKVEGGRMYPTGRKRKACSHLECMNCLKRYAVDDTFDGSFG